MPGTASFHVEERLLSRLCLDTFPFGTAMLTPPETAVLSSSNIYSLSVIYPKAAQAQQILDQVVSRIRRDRG